MKSPIKNLIINSAGVLLTSSIAFLMIPAYTSAFGIEDYAIYVTWIFVIALCQFLDFGYSTTIIKFSGDKEGGGTFLQKVASYEVIIILSIILLTTLSFCFKFPVTGVYADISEELGQFAVTLFFLPVFMSNLVKFYSFAFLAKGHFYLYNFSIVSTEIFRQVGGFLVLKFFSSWTVFFYYQIITVFVMYILFRMTLSIVCNDSYSYLYKNIKTNFSNSLEFTKVIFFSALLGAVMSTFDRAVLTLNFSKSEVAVYSACFIVASIINMVIQPFHRLTLPLFINLYNENNFKKIEEYLISLSSLLSLSTLLLGGFMVLFAEEYMSFLIVTEHSIDASSIITILSLSFWFVACGWLPANLLQAVGKPNIQMKCIIVALFVGVPLSLYFSYKDILIGVAAIWFIHGLIQFLFVPIVSSKITGYFKVYNWVLSVVIVNLVFGVFVLAFSLGIKSSVGIIPAVFVYMAITSTLILFSLFRFKKIHAKV